MLVLIPPPDIQPEGNGFAFEPTCCIDMNLAIWSYRVWCIWKCLLAGVSFGWHRTLNAWVSTLRATFSLQLAWSFHFLQTGMIHIHVLFFYPLTPIQLYRCKQSWHLRSLVRLILMFEVKKMPKLSPHSWIRPSGDSLVLRPLPLWGCACQSWEIHSL